MSKDHPPDDRLLTVEDLTRRDEPDSEAEALARKLTLELFGERLVKLVGEPVRQLREAVLRFVLRQLMPKHRRQQKSGADSAKARSLKAEENHAEWADYAVERARELDPEFYAQRGQMTRLATRMLAQWPEELLGDPPSRDWLCKVLSEQRVRERITEALEK